MSVVRKKNIKKVSQNDTKLIEKLIQTFNKGTSTKQPTEKKQIESLYFKYIKPLYAYSGWGAVDLIKQIKLSGRKPDNETEAKLWLLQWWSMITDGAMTANKIYYWMDNKVTADMIKWGYEAR